MGYEYEADDGGLVMVRVTYGAPRHQTKVRYFKSARGFRGGRSKLWRTVRESMIRSWAYAFRDRRQRKRQFRRLWIVRINAAAREEGLSYSGLMHGLKRAGVEVDRKVLAEMAVNERDAFRQLVEVAKAEPAA